MSSCGGAWVSCVGMICITASALANIIYNGQDGLILTVAAAACTSIVLKKDLISAKLGK